MLDRLAAVAVAVAAPALLVAFGAHASGLASVVPASGPASARVTVGGVGAESFARQSRQVAVSVDAEIKERARLKVYTVAVDCANGGCGAVAGEAAGQVAGEATGGATGDGWLVERQGPTVTARVVAGVGLLLALGAGVGLYVGHRRGDETGPEASTEPEQTGERRSVRRR
ncbi:hypothetical protein ACIBF1_43165 [Spirillospora sp. NPDC050679]